MNKWKKIATAFPLYLAGIILLAFAFFPHHHHDHYICFNNTHTHSSSQETKPASAPFSKEHCIYYLFQTDLQKNTSRSAFQEEGPDFHSFIFTCYVLAEILAGIKYATTVSPFPQAQDEAFHQLEWVSHKPSRAPPFLNP